MQEVVAEASAVLDAGGKIAVHCHAGFGRTGLLIACILVRRDGLSAAEAIAKVRSRRASCIQNSRQRDFVHAFAAASTSPSREISGRAADEEQPVRQESNDPKAEGPYVEPLEDPVGGHKGDEELVV
jgi:hypothetical protein